VARRISWFRLRLRHAIEKHVVDHLVEIDRDLLVLHFPAISLTRRRVRRATCTRFRRVAAAVSRSPCEHRIDWRRHLTGGRARSAGTRGKH
jgi:hypothetical protein